MDLNEILTEEFFEREYIRKRRTTYDIADEIGVSPTTIQRRLKKLGLIRSNSESHKSFGLSFSKGYLLDRLVLNKIPVSKLAKEHGCTPGCIYKYVWKYNIELPKYSKVSKYADKLTREFLFNEYVVKKKSVVSIADEFGYDKNSVYKFLKKYGFNRSYEESFVVRFKKKYNFKVFKDINKFSAYFLGFFLADGSLVFDGVGGYRTVFNVGIKTLPVIEYLCDVVGGNVRIYNKDDMSDGKAYIYSIGSKYFYKIMKNKYGFDNEKTYNVRFPDYIPDEFMPYFFRGYFDGDGSWYIRNDGHIVASCVSASKNYIDGMYKYLNNVLGINARYRAYNLRGYDTEYYTITMNGYSALDFYNYVYKDLLESRVRPEDLTIDNVRNNNIPSFALNYKYASFIDRVL